MVQCRACCLPGDVGRVAGRALCAFDRLLHGGQSLHHGAVRRVALQKCAHARQVGGCVGQPVQGAAPEVLQLLGIGIGLLCQGLDLLHHGHWVATLVHAQLQLCQPVAGLPGLLVQLGQLLPATTLTIPGTAPQSTTDAPKQLLRREGLGKVVVGPTPGSAPGGLDRHLAGHHDRAGARRQLPDHTGQLKTRIEAFVERLKKR